MKVLYTAEATATGGRIGGVRTSDGKLELKLDPPAELGGPEDGGSNPEQLFAAGYAACFHSALLIVAHGKKLNAEDSSVTARVGFGPLGDESGWGLNVTLCVDVPHLDKDAAQRLAERAHRHCPYSNAIRGNLAVELEVRSAVALDDAA